MMNQQATPSPRILLSLSTILLWLVSVLICSRSKTSMAPLRTTLACSPIDYHRPTKTTSRFRISSCHHHVPSRRSAPCLTSLGCLALVALAV